MKQNLFDRRSPNRNKAEKPKQKQHFGLNPFWLVSLSFGFELHVTASRLHFSRDDNLHRGFLVLTIVTCVYIA